MLELRPHDTGVACPMRISIPPMNDISLIASLTVWPLHLAPDHPDLRSPDLLLAAVDVCDALAQVERCGLRVLDALNLDQRGVGVGEPLAALVGDVLALDISMYPVSARPSFLSLFQGDCR